MPSCPSFRKMSRNTGDCAESRAKKASLEQAEAEKHQYKAGAESFV